MSQGWCTVESDPGVFTELIEKIGVKGVQVAELYELSAETMDALKPVYGLIFLFKWVKDDKDNRATLDNLPNVFFAKQVISNACATQAILNVLLNRQDIDLGPELTRFKEFSSGLPADLRGEQIGNCAPIRVAHNSFSRPEPFVFDQKAATADDDVYHFVGYVPVGNNVYELDGLKSGPILLGEFTENKWLDVARPAIQERITRYSQKEIRFNLLALVRNRREVYEEKKAKLSVSQKQLEEKLKNSLDSEEKKKYQGEIKEKEGEKKELDEKIRAEVKIREEWASENVRRKHNYIPFIYNLLKILAEKGKLKELREEGKKESLKRDKKNAEKKKADANKKNSKCSNGER